MESVIDRSPQKTPRRHSRYENPSMPLHINDKHTIALARRLAGMTGETVADAVATAIGERLARIEQCQSGERFLAGVPAISARVRRQGWDEAFKAIAASGDDAPLLSDVFDRDSNR